MSGDVEAFLAARPEPVRRIAEALRFHASSVAALIREARDRAGSAGP